MVRLYIAALASTLSLISAAPTVHPRDAVTVNIAQGSVIGSSSNGIDSFQGVPFAQPPVGRLRLRKPVAITTTGSVIMATSKPNACPQMKSNFNSNTNGLVPDNVVNQIENAPLGQDIMNESEDCLFVNVFRPSSFVGKLPVVFWIYGGAFENGGISSFDPTSLIQASVAKGRPVMYVSVAYRVNAFGFLAGKQVTKEDVANLGLHDQRMGLQWVADNVAAFGGDTTKVTIWGESAGSISVFDQMILFKGDNTYKGKPLFRAALMDSGSVVPALRTDSQKGENVFQNFAAAAGCGSAPAATVLDCLRSVDYATFHIAANSLPSASDYQSTALQFLPRPDGAAMPESPEIMLQKGQYTKVPMMIGDQEDEGTLFALAQRNITTTDQIVDYLQTFFFTEAPRQSIVNIVNSYPDDPSAGSPFRTGTQNNIYPQYKRLAAMLGDFAFTLSRRKFLEIATSISPKVPAYSYLSTYFYGTPVLGTFHATDLVEIYGSGALTGVTPSPATPGFASASIFEYYINFFNDMDPNSGLLANAAYIAGLSPQWPQWQWGKNLLQFGAATNTIIPDDFRPSQYSALYDPANTGLRV